MHTGTYCCCYAPMKRLCAVRNCALHHDPESFPGIACSVTPKAAKPPPGLFAKRQRTPPPASNCSPVSQYESFDARNTAIDAMSSG